MVNITVYSREYVEIESEKCFINNQEDMINFLKKLLDKVHYSGEAICLESAEIQNSEGKHYFTEIERWH